jgi:AcrR family transcriptional regulator
MDEVIAAAGVSSSVVYRWVSGKDELLAAAVRETLEGGLAVLAEALEMDPPPSLAKTLELIITANLARTTRHGQDLTPIAVQVWAEALTSPTIRRLVADLYTQLRDGLAELIRRHQDAGAISADVDPESAAHPLFSMIPGFLLQRLLLGPEDPKTYARAADAILRA